MRSQKLSVLTTKRATTQNRGSARHIATTIVTIAALLTIVNSTTTRATDIVCPASEAQLPQGVNGKCDAYISDLEGYYFGGVERQDILRIPIVFHVIYPEDDLLPEANLSRAVVEDQVAHLNKLFRGEYSSAGTGVGGVDTRIEFYLPKFNARGEETWGIDWSENTSWFTMLKESSELEEAADSLSMNFANPPYPTDEYVNVYVIGEPVELPYPLTPAWNWQFPWDGVGNAQRGICIPYTWIYGIGGAHFLTDNNGTWLAHELGHYFGLYHVFQGDACAETPGSCATEGDLICDTTPQKDEVWDCQDPVGCQNQIADNRENVMDYTDELCRGGFTTDQAARMRCAILSWLPSLYRPHGFYEGPDYTMTDGSEAAAVLGGRNESTNGLMIYDLDEDGILDIYHANDVGSIGQSHIAMQRADGSFRIPGASESANYNVLFQEGVEVSGVGELQFGESDALLLSMRAAPNAVAVRNGTGRYTNERPAAGLLDQGGSMMAVADFNRDGALDVFVTVSGGASHYLYTAIADEEYSRTAVIPQGGTAGATNCCTIDINDDGWLDIVVTSAVTASAVLVNDGTGVLVDESLDPRWAEIAGLGGCRGCVAADLLGDNGEELLLLQINSLAILESDGQSQWVDRSEDVLPSDPLLTDSEFWSASVLDWDNDGYLDIVAGTQQLEVDVYLESLDGTSFTLSEQHRRAMWNGASELAQSRCIVPGDINDDGWPDLVIGRSGESNVLLHNAYAEQGSGNNWIKLAFDGLDGNMHSHGAEVVLSVQGRTIARRHQVLSSTPAVGPRELLIGVGDDTVISSIEVTWPTGTRRTLQDVSVNQEVSVAEPAWPILVNQSSATGLDYEGEPYASVAFDYNGDSEEDLFVTSSTATGSLHELEFMLESGVPHFVKVLASKFGLVADQPQADLKGVSFADYDNDGDLDVFAGENDKPRLYRNNSDGSFTDVAASLGIRPESDAHMQCGIWGDYDGDGWVDLFVGRGETNPGSETGLVEWPNWLFYNQLGSGGGFANATSFAQIDQNPAQHDCTLSASWADFDNDGDLDLFVPHTIDAVPSGPDAGSHLYVNQGNATFIESSDALFPANIVEVSGASWVDIDSDADLDLLCSSDAAGYVGTRLYVNDNGQFSYVSADVGLSWVGETRGAAPFDLDLDGMVDILTIPLSSSSVPQIHRNVGTLGDAEFVDIGSTLGLPAESTSGQITHDFNGDGDLDVFLGRPVASDAYFYQNASNAGTDAPENHWAAVEFASDISCLDNRASLGATVTMKLDGVPRQVQVVDGGSMRGGQQPLRLTFGLEQDTTSSIQFAVVWPSGVTTTVAGTRDGTTVIGGAERGEAPPQIVSLKDVTATYQPIPGEEAYLVFEWTTDSYYGCPDTVTLSSPSGTPPECWTGVASWSTLHGDAFSTIQQQPDGTYHHQFLIVDFPCVGGCSLLYEVSSGFNMTTSGEISPQGTLSMPYCVQ